jgi:hypothetical protein
MASFPTAKVHRVSRRKLGKGQHVQLPPVTITATASTTTITLTFSQPVVVAGIIPLVSNTGTFVSQTVVSQTVVQQVWSTSQAAATWSIAGGVPQIATFQGGGNAPAGGTF